MRRVWIDFTDSEIDRLQFRRMDKTFKKIKMYSHSEGKKLIFNINKDVVADAFLISCLNALKEDGFICKLIFK